MLKSLVSVAKKQDPDSAVYFDITDIVDHASKNRSVTGIQRIVTRVLADIIKNDTRSQYFGLVTASVSGECMAADLSFLRGVHNYTDFYTRFNRAASRETWLQHKLRNCRPNTLKFHLKKKYNTLRWLLSRRLRAKWGAVAKSPKPSCLMALNLKEGDVIVTMGAGWCTEYSEVHELARRFGCRTISVVHDIMPITHPIFAPDSKHRFRNWVDYIAMHSDGICVNSYFTRNELLLYFRSKGIYREIDVMKLPHEFKKGDGGVASRISREVALIASSRFVLSIGTLDPRKNVLGLLYAWQKLYEQGLSMPGIVVCGATGRASGEIQEFLRLNPVGIGNAVTIIHNPNDAELELLYQSCQFTVFPSFVEGWGLPIGESLWFKKPVLCANCASMPEVGGKFAVYFDHSKPDSLRDALRQMIENPVKMPDNIREQLLTWEDTAASVCAIVHSDHTVSACA